MTSSGVPSFRHASQAVSFIDGAFVPPGSAPALPVINPADETELATLNEAGAAEVDAAVGAARRAFEEGVWCRRPVEERQAVLHKIHDLILHHGDELAYLECLNTGLPIAQVRRRHVPRAARNFSFFADYIGQARGDVYTQADNYVTMVTREPVGVAALIAPWNAPLPLATMKIAGAIAFGNSCVLKPSEFTPLSFMRLMELFDEAGVPPGVVNMVNGRGRITGAALVAHEGVDVVAFTGGTETGRAIGAAAGQGLKKVMMELGGKSANIIFETADVERALDGALLGIYSNNGQQCLAGSRILVQRSIADSFIAEFVRRTKNIRLGDPLDPATELGPLISRRQMERVLSYVEAAKQEGCELLTGGKRPQSPGRGFYVEPVAVRAPSNDCRVCQEEIFGPFATFLVFDHVDEAIALANDTAYGLAAYVWSNDMPTLMRVASAMRAGVVWVNTPMMRELRAPFGGYKASGVGRTGGAASEEVFTEEKTTTWPLAPVAPPRLGAAGDAGGEGTGP